MLFLLDFPLESVNYLIMVNFDLKDIIDAGLAVKDETVELECACHDGRS